MLSFHFPADFHIELGGEFRGARYLDETTDRNFGALLSAETEDKQDYRKPCGLVCWREFCYRHIHVPDGYELAQDNLDFGLELRF